MQSYLLSATFYGSFITLFISGEAWRFNILGYLADRLGPKMILIGAALTYAVVSFLSPLLANNSYFAFFASRVFMGFGEVRNYA